jgi:hypothetical protein
MKVSLSLCVTAFAAASAEGDVLARIEALEANNARLDAKNAEITAKYSEMQAALNGELKIFSAGECPPGWVEFNKTQGYLLTGRPRGGEAGTTINRPMDAGEKGRSPEHSHEVGVEDLGHTHVTTVNDPGHGHEYIAVGYGTTVKDVNGNNAGGLNKKTSVAKTGIIVDALPAKSNIQVSLASNEDGEGYPLVYVLICQFLGV